MRRLPLLLTLATLTSAGAAHAQPSDAKALAEQLFVEGKDATKRGDWAAACPKFEASLRYDPALGTRLNLAACYEKVGKVASAWAMFKESIDLARKAGDNKRREFATQQAALLEPRLPKLTITLTGGPPAGLVVTRGGTTVDAALYGSAMIVDPGEHEIVASAPDHEPFTTTIVLVEGKPAAVEIPPLTPVPPTGPTGPDGDGDGDGDTDADGDGDADGDTGPAVGRVIDRGRGRRTMGLVTAGVGVAAIGVGAYFGLAARSTFAEAEDACGGDLICDDQASLAASQAKVDDARGQALGATVLIGVGAAAVVAGGVLYLTAPGRERVDGTALRVTPVLGRDRAALVLGGRF